MSRAKACKVAFPLAACAVLSACVSSQTAQSEHSLSSLTPVLTSTVTSAVTVAQTSVEHSSPLPPVETIPTVVSTSVQEECMDSAPNPLAAVGAAPIVSGGGEQFSFSIIQEHFDACANLSWSVIAGSAGPGNSQRQGVVFFHQGEIISSPAPLLEEEITAVEPVGVDSLKVSYQILDGPRAAAQTIPGSVIFTLTPAGTLQITENNLPLASNEAGIQLDLSNL